MSLMIESNSAKQTEEIGQKLATILEPGDIIALTGELGAGKTVLTKGIAKGLEVKETITSPTFTIIREYQGRLPLFHFDVYRIESPQLEELGYEEYFFSDGVSIIEWSERIADKLPKNYLEVAIDYGLKENERKLDFIAHGKWEKRIWQLKKMF